MTKDFRKGISSLTEQNYLIYQFLIHHFIQKSKESQKESQGKSKEYISKRVMNVSKIVL